MLALRSPASPNKIYNLGPQTEFSVSYSSQIYTLTHVFHI